MDTSTELANGLDRDIAALKAKAADYGARHCVIEKCIWPQGAHIAVNFTADFDAMLLRRVLNEPPMQLTKGEFGGGLLQHCRPLWPAGLERHHAFEHPPCCAKANCIHSMPSAQQKLDYAVACFCVAPCAASGFRFDANCSDAARHENFSAHARASAR